MRPLNNFIGVNTEFTMLTEQWKSIEGYKGLYEVSNLGQVRSLDRVMKVDNHHNIKMKKYKGMVLKPLLSQRKHSRVSLYKEKTSKRHLIHRLVAFAFIPNPENKPHINHLDSDPTNNRVDNLEWVTPKENALHAKLAGRAYLKGEKSNNHKLTEIEVTQIRKSKGKIRAKDLAKIYNCGESTIYDIFKKRYWSHI